MKFATIILGLAMIIITSGAILFVNEPQTAPIRPFDPYDRVN